MRSWTERTGVYDDICYLRQAHLFQRFGVGGFDTNINRDDDRYFATLAREIGYEGWDNPALAPCHPQIGEKRVLQYPPGTGLALALFPAGFQRVSLYAIANLYVFLAAVLAISCARRPHEIAGSGIVGMAAIYFMINPSKASYSMAPTMIVCATVGLFDGDYDKRHKLVAPSLGCDSGRLLHGIGGLVQASKPSARRWLLPSSTDTGDPISKVG